MAGEGEEANNLPSSSPWFRISIVSFYGRYLRRCLSAAGLSQHTLQIDDDTTIHFWGPDPPFYDLDRDSDSDPDSANHKGKPPLILIHGFGPDALWQWRQQASYFARDFALYIPNLVFFGNSRTKSSAPWSEIFQAEAIVKLAEKLGMNKYSVVGTSYGGFVAYRMASMWPERVDKVVIASSGVNMTKKDNEELVKRADVKKIEEVLLPASPHQLRNLLSLATFNFTGMSYLPDFFFNDLVHKLYAENRKEKMELLKGLALGRQDTVHLSPLHQEVLIVWGEHDKIFLLEKANQLKELLGEKTRLQIIENAAHVPQIERPGRFNKIVKNFLQGST
ncbi:Triacylglycerol lipase [Bertholletia excelsa]